MSTSIPLFRDQPYLQTTSAKIVRIEGDWVLLDRTVFYPQGGGQPGDTGSLRLEDGTILAVIDTQKGEAAGDIRHLLEPGAVLEPGVAVEAAIDWPRRHNFMRLHTALHLLSVFAPGRISGASIGEDKGRIDFALDEGARLDKEELQARLDDAIAQDIAVETEWVEDEELDRRPDLIKTFTVRPPTGQGRVRLVRIGALDIQPCGGTHVAATGEIGKLSIVKIENKGKFNRRVVVGLADGN